MAGKALIFRFYVDKRNENDAVTAVCRICGQLIRGVQGVTSNFVTHLKRRHQAEFEEYDRERRLDGNYMSFLQVRRPANAIPSPAITFEDPSNKFHPDHPRQRAISNAIINHLIQDLRPLWTLESKGFHELLSTFEPRYEILSAEELCNSWLPSTSARIEDALRLALIQTECVTITVEIYTADNSYPLFGIAAHFPTPDWQIKMQLLMCRALDDGDLTSDFLFTLFEEVLEKFQIKEKLTSVIVRSLLDARKVFSLPGLSTLNFNSSENPVNDHKEADSVHKLIEMVQWPKKIICFTQVLQMLIKNILEETTIIETVLSKVQNTIQLIQKSSPSSEVVQSICAKVSKTGIKWNSQLKLLRHLESLNIEGMADINHKLRSYDLAVLREILDILEPFEEAIDNMESDSHVPISLVLPTLIGLDSVLQQENLTYLASMRILLSKMLEEKLGYLHTDPLFISATVIDPRFKMSWCPDDKILFIKSSVRHFATISNLLPQEIKPSCPTSSEIQASVSNSPPKKKRLFSFIKDASTPFKPSSIDQEMELYLKEPRLDIDTNPFHYWASKTQDLPILSKLARLLLSIPATATPMERTFSNLKTMVLPDNTRLVPQNLETMLFIKFNQTFS